MLNKQRRVRPLFAEGGARRATRGARAIRRRRGCLHRRSRLHPAVRLPVAVGQAHRRSAEGRSGRRDRQELRRLRQLRRGRGSRGALPVVLSRRHHPQPELVDRFVVGLAPGGDRLFCSAAAKRSASCSRIDAEVRPHERSVGNADASADRYTTERPICVAILAMGGQGGGVLADWIVALAESQGWPAQSTSVPGVAQRTGATIYYIEMLPPKAGRAPVLSLMPTPGDVDVVIAAELMEAGRSMLRGLVTPERTTLIASTHRAFAVGGEGKARRRRRRSGRGRRSPPASRRSASSPSTWRRWRPRTAA